jgi:hypothetical protein
MVPKFKRRRLKIRELGDFAHAQYFCSDARVYGMAAADLLVGDNRRQSKNELQNIIRKYRSNYSHYILFFFIQNYFRYVVIGLLPYASTLSVICLNKWTIFIFCLVFLSLTPNIQGDG